MPIQQSLLRLVFQKLPRAFGDFAAESEMTKTIALAAVAWSSVLGGWTVFQARPPEGLMTWRMPTVLTLHEPLILDVAIANSSGTPVALEFGLGDVTHYEFDVVRPDGSRASVRPRTTRPPEERAWFESTGHLEVAPGASAARWVVVNQYLDLNQTGVYDLTVRFDGTVKAESGTNVAVPRTLEENVRVLPRDESALARVCRELAISATEVSVDRRQRAVAALTSINDPVVIPYLVQAAQAEVTGTAEIEALVRLGEPEARKALETLAQGPQGWTAEAARSALKRIK